MILVAALAAVRPFESRRISRPYGSKFSRWHFMSSSFSFDMVLLSVIRDLVDCSNWRRRCLISLWGGKMPQRGFTKGQELKRVGGEGGGPQLRHIHFGRKRFLLCVL